MTISFSLQSLADTLSVHNKQNWNLSLTQRDKKIHFLHLESFIELYPICQCLFDVQIQMFEILLISNNDNTHCFSDSNRISTFSWLHVGTSTIFIASMLSKISVYKSQNPHSVFMTVIKHMLVQTSLSYWSIQGLQRHTSLCNCYIKALFTTIYMKILILPTLLLCILSRFAR